MTWRYWRDYAWWYAPVLWAWARLLAYVALGVVISLWWRGYLG